MTPATPPYADTNSFKLCSVASTASCSLTGAFSDFSVEAARAGMARSYVYDYKPVSRYPEIRAAEEDARGAHRGLSALQRPHRIHASLTQTEHRPRQLITPSNCRDSGSDSEQDS
jgi:hypothetical protein